MDSWPSRARRPCCVPPRATGVCWAGSLTAGVRGPHAEGQATIRNRRGVLFGRCRRRVRLLANGSPRGSPTSAAPGTGARSGLATRSPTTAAQRDRTLRRRPEQDHPALARHASRRGSLVTHRIRAYDLLRMLGRDGRPTPLGQGFVEYGRIAETLHLLAMVDPLTAGQAHGWLRFGVIRWATVPAMDRLIARLIERLPQLVIGGRTVGGQVRHVGVADAAGDRPWWSGRRCSTARTPSSIVHRSTGP